MENKRYLRGVPTFFEEGEEIVRSQRFVRAGGLSVYISKKDPENPKPATGRAYAFFDCDASLERLRENMHLIRGYARTPEDLELRLHEGVPQLNLGEEFAERMEEPADYRAINTRIIDKERRTPEIRPLSSMEYILDMSLEELPSPLPTIVMSDAIE